MCAQALDRHFGFAHKAENYTDQVCLGLAAHKMGLRWRQLDPSHNFPMASFLPHADLPEELAQARVLHYHDAMQPHFWATCLERLAPAHPEVHAWLSAREPLADPAPRPLAGGPRGPARRARRAAPALPLHGRDGVAMSATAAVTDRAGAPAASRDVVFAFFSIAWTRAFERQLVMPEDRLASP